jgi:hypothetical protein
MGSEIKTKTRGSFRGAKPLSHILPLSFEGEGDTGSEVEK